MAVQRVSFAPQGGFGGANRAAFLQNSKNIGQGLNRIKSARELKNFKAELGAGGDPAALMAKYPQFRKEIEGITSFKQTQQNKADRKEMVDLRVALEGGTESTWEYLQKRMEAYKASGDEAGANRVQKLGMAYIQNPEGVTEKIVREHTLRFPDDAEKILGVEALGQKGSNALKALEIEQGKLVTERDKAKTAHVNANTAKKKQEADEKYKDAELKLKENQQEIDAINAGKPSTALEKRAIELKKTGDQARTTYSKATDIMNRLDTVTRSTGWGASIVEMWKDATGSQDEASTLMKDMANLKNIAVRSQRSAGEGTMSDADLKLLAAGVPHETASNAQWMDWLSALKRYSAYTQVSSQLEDEWINNVGAVGKKYEAKGNLPTVGGYAVAPNDTFYSFMKRLDDTIYSKVRATPDVPTSPVTQQAQPAPNVPFTIKSVR